MKKVLLLALSLTLVVGLAFAKPMQVGPQKKALDIESQFRMPQNMRNVPEYSFSVNPTVIGVNYYDYMVGSYNGLPLHVKQNGDGYFLIYHGKATNSTSAYRRAYYAAINADGIVTDHGEITRTAKNEGYPAMAVDPVAGKPFYTWHANADADAELEVEVASDSYYEGMIGNFNEISIAIDNPWTTIDPNPDGLGDTDDNEYIWPQMAIGPSPVAGMRRVYVSGRNAANHTPWDGDVAPSENPLFAYADFDTDMVEFGEPLVWHYTNIPIMDGWHLAGDGTWRRPSNALFVDNIGNVYYIGHHFGYDADSNAIEENTADLFICSNYGAGEWVYVSGDPDRATWNPDNGQGEGYFQGDDGPFADEDLVWNIANSSHFNAVRLNNGKFLFPTIMAMSTHDGSYYPAFQYPKTVVIDPVNGDVVVNDIYPRKSADDDYNTLFTPWDVEAPYGVPEYVVGSDGLNYLSPEVVYPFPHYNADLHESSMMFHYNGIRVSEPNDDGLMVAVWQDSYRAKLYNDNGYDEYADYQNTPEIWISVSADGYNWSDPITVNNVDTLPQFNNIKPMWVYPANKVITVNTLPTGEKVGKIGIMFLDDFTWGSTVHNPPAHNQNDGGNMMFMELQITFPHFVSAEDETAPSIVNMLNQNYPNPFNPETNISFDMPVAGNAKVEVFNVKGQLVKTLYNGNAPYGKTNVVWSGDDNNGNQVSSGVYFYRLNTDHGTQTRKMMLMK